MDESEDGLEWPAEASALRDLRCSILLFLLGVLGVMGIVERGAKGYEVGLRVDDLVCLGALNGFEGVSGDCRALGGDNPESPLRQEVLLLELGSMEMAGSIFWMAARAGRLSSFFTHVMLVLLTGSVCDGKASASLDESYSLPMGDSVGGHGTLAGVGLRHFLASTSDDWSTASTSRAGDLKG